MSRILAIDYGRKRAGLAVTDPLQMIATGLRTEPAHTLLTFVIDYTAKENVETIVIGYPKNMNNKASDAVKYIDPFIRKLKKELPGVKIELMDERFTSKLASKSMIESGLKKKDRQNKALIDEISATIILQSFLERKKILGS